MASQTLNLKYKDHFKYRAPEINLPFSKPTIIFSYFNLDGEEYDPRKSASCKICDKRIEIIFGSSVNSSYTFGLTFHLKNHPSEWDDYLQRLSKNIVPDSKTKYEHYKEMTRPRLGSKASSDRRFDDCNLNWNINESFSNPAGVRYRLRDREFLQNSFHTFIEGHNAKMFEYLFSFTNRNLTLYDLMGTKHPNANLQTNYKKSKCLFDNIGNMTIDLQRLFCEFICFHDPELYDNCPNDHTGDIAVFADETYQNSFPNFNEEIEKYPEFLNNKSFDHQLLKNVNIVEHNRVAKMEMNRLLKIVVSILTVKKKQFRVKIEEIKSRSKVENNLVKPPLAINRWGPKYCDIDVPEELDKGQVYPEKMFSTFHHVKNEECPAFNDESKVLSHEPTIKDGKVKYPCNVGGCEQDCECDPCTDKEPLLCPKHNPDHPLMFDPEEDFFITRRMFFDPISNETIFKRPNVDSKLSPPDLLLAGLKVECKICKRNVRNHLKHHHTLHPGVCDICNHMEFISKNSCNLVCYVCMKKFESIYNLEDHMNIHNPEGNPHFCKVCDKGFPSKFNYERHISENHAEKQEKYNCDKCDASFTLERNLKRHIEEKHTGKEIGEYKCNLCERSYNRKYNLLKHKRIEHNINDRKAILPGVNDEENVHQCFLCDKIFKQKFTLERHLETIHFQDSQVVFKCKTCEKSFRRKDKLQYHEKTHIIGDAKIICEICLKQFKSKDGLKAHRIGNHEGNKNN